MFWQIHLLAVTSAGSASIWRAGLREIVTLTGMILVSSPLKEYDKRIEILTREQGRIPAFAQGARKQRPVCMYSSVYIWGIPGV